MGSEVLNQPSLLPLIPSPVWNDPLRNANLLCPCLCSVSRFWHGVVYHVAALSNSRITVQSDDGLWSSAPENQELTPTRKVCDCFCRILQEENFLSAKENPQVERRIPSDFEKSQEAIVGCQGWHDGFLFTMNFVWWVSRLEKNAISLINLFLFE